MRCKICSSESTKLFSATLINKYLVDYYHCLECGFLQTEEPYWLKEAYDSPINVSDTGMLSRNLDFSRKTAPILYFLFDSKGKYLDYAGGYGTLTRLMRDIGFDFYWSDPHTHNFHAKGFEYIESIGEVELITSFESFEHFVDPIKEIERMLKISKNILFSTEILPYPVPAPEKWQYYGTSHGQHISFYSLKTMQIVAEKFGLNLCSNGKDLHLLSEKYISNRLFNLLLKSSSAIIWLVRMNMKSRTISDSEAMILESSNKNP